LKSQFEFPPPSVDFASSALIGMPPFAFESLIRRKMLTFALGRGLEPYDGPTIASILATLERDPRLETLVLEVARSFPFRNRR
jgi:hypothetical protein